MGVFWHVRLCQQLLTAFQASEPAPDWGPYLKQYRGDRYANMHEPVEALNHSKENITEKPMELPGEANPVFEQDELQTKMWKTKSFSFPWKARSVWSRTW